MDEITIDCKLFPSIVFFKEEVEAFIENTKGSIAAHMLAVLVTVAFLYTIIPSAILASYVLLHASYIFLRLFFTQKMHHLLQHHELYSRNKVLKHDKNSKVLLNHRLERLMQAQLMTVFYGGVLWAMVPILVYIYAYGSEHIYFIMAILFGVTAGAMATLSSVAIGFLLYITPILAVLILVLLSWGSSDAYMIAFLTLIFYFVVVRSGRKLFQALHENYILNHKLERSSYELSNFNAKLEEKVEAQSRALKRTLFTDKNTGLENQFALMQKGHFEEKSFMLLLDISSFSTINRSFGKSFGDKVLHKVASALKRQKQQNMELYKGEADRFIFIVFNRTPKELESFCQELFAFFDLFEIHIEGESLHVNFNIGITPVQEGEDIFINAEFALEESKKRGSRQYAFYSDRYELQKSLIQNIKLVKDLIEEDAIVPYFQAIKDIKANEINKYEVLARGVKDAEIIAPYRFLDAAKHIGVLSTITRMMIKKSFAFFEHNQYEFSLNITEFDLKEGYLIPYLKTMMKRYSIDPKRITFEVLEHISMNDEHNKILEALKALKSLGCKIAIDDFGVENSNFLRLLELEFDILKLDAVFIQSIEHSEKNQKIVEGLVKLAHTMDIRVVAEFVSNKEIYEILKKLEVDYAQGYHIAKPSDSLVIKEYD